MLRERRRRQRHIEEEIATEKRGTKEERKIPTATGRTEAERQTADSETERQRERETEIFLLASLFP
jgi:hypothetical protein